MTNAWGVWLNKSVSSFDFNAALAGGCSFAVCDITSGTNIPKPGVGQVNLLYNGNWPAFVQSAYDAGLRNIFGCYRFDIGQAPHMAQDLPNWKAANLNANNAIIRDILKSVTSKYMQVLIIEIGSNSTKIPPDSDKIITDVWYSTVIENLMGWLRWNIAKTNPHIKHVVLMHPRYTIDKFYPALVGHPAFADEIVCCDVNVSGGGKTLTSFANISNEIVFQRPSNCMSVTYGKGWIFSRFANASFAAPGFNSPVGLVDFNYSDPVNFAWQPNVISIPEPEPETPPLVCYELIESISAEILNIEKSIQNIKNKMKGAK